MPAALVGVLVTLLSGAGPVTRTGAEIYTAECAACHGAKGDGAGPAASLLSSRPRDFTRGPFKLRSTLADPPTAEDLYKTVTRGIRAHAMPSFEFLPEDERRRVVQQVLDFGKWPAKRPASIAVVEPKVTPELLKRGQELYAQVQCGKCHAPHTGDQLDSPILKDDSGASIHAPNLSNGHFLGEDGAADLYLRISTGMSGSPMPAFATALSEADRWALAHYVHSLRQKIERPRRRFEDPRAEAANLLNRYRCNACHILSGAGGQVGPVLDTVAAKSKVSWLRAWLTNPRGFGKIYNEKPYRMPHLALTTHEVDTLVAYLLTLAKRDVDEEDSDPPFAPGEKALSIGRSTYEASCPKCHDLGKIIPASVPNPTGPDLIRLYRRVNYGWLLDAVKGEGVPPDRAGQVRDFLWKTAKEKGP